MIDLVAGNNQTGPGVSARALTETTAPCLWAMAAARSMATRFITRGMARVAATFLALFHQGMVVEGGAHDLVHQVEGGQSRDVHRLTGRLWPHTG